MEAKKFARKIEEYFFTKDNTLNGLYWLAFKDILRLKEGRNELTYTKSIVKHKTFLDKIGVVYEVGKRKYGRATIWYIELDKKGYNQMKDFIFEYNKYQQFAKETKLEHRYTDSIIIDYIADGIYCNI
jgi:tRNA(His) 5'-end guanylyltransferase